MGVTVWEMVMICSSWDQVTPATPVQGVPRVPDGVRPEEGELAAVLRDLADLGHLHPVAELSQDRPVNKIQICKQIQSLSSLPPHTK